MPQICVICRKDPFPGDITRSFHRFPKNSEQRQKWMTVTGVKEVKKVHAVCSDHFQEDSYHQTDGYTRLRRLLPTAVPDINICYVAVPETDTCNEALLKQSTQNIMTLVPRQEDQNFNKICLINVDSQTVSNESDSIYISSDLLPQPKVTEKTTTCDKSVNSERKPVPIPDPDGSSKSRKRFRFMDGTSACYVSRHDVVSDEAWARILKIMQFQNKQIACAKKRNWRRGKQIPNIKEVDKSLHIKSKIKRKKNIICS